MCVCVCVCECFLNVGIVLSWIIIDTRYSIHHYNTLRRNSSFLSIFTQTNQNSQRDMPTLIATILKYFVSVEQIFQFWTTVDICRAQINICTVTTYRFLFYLNCVTQSTGSNNLVLSGSSKYFFGHKCAIHLAFTWIIVVKLLLLLITVSFPLIKQLLNFPFWCSEKLRSQVAT